MIQLTKALSAWGTPEFREVLKAEIQGQGEALPLQQGLSSSSYALTERLDVLILDVQEEVEGIRVKAGIFYSGIIAGCNCADDPTPVDENNEYCEVGLLIDRATGEATVALWSS